MKKQLHQRSYLVALQIAVALVFFSIPASVSAVSVDKATYVLGEEMVITCSNASNGFHVYNLLDSNDENNIGFSTFACSDENSGFVFDYAGDYAVLEFTGSCDGETYGVCKSHDFFVSEAFFEYTSQSGSWVSGSGIQTNKSEYFVDELVLVHCENVTDVFQLYDVTTDTLAASLGGLGSYDCGSPAHLDFGGAADHRYALLELDIGSTCENRNYASCRSLGSAFYPFEAFFSVVRNPNILSSLYASYRPEVTILSPKSGDIFGVQGLISYRALDKNDNGSFTEREQLGLIGKPVSLFYSDRVIEWDHTLVDSADKTVIEEKVSNSGSYVWNIKDLLPGIFYRVIVEALDAIGDLGADVSGFFTVDFDAPVFTVTSDPPVTRSHDVTVVVQASKSLKAVPVVTVTQEGAETVTLAMKGTENRYEGVYKIIAGHDGVAKITVVGTDLAGNKGTTIVSGDSFAVGIEPPPPPVITSPKNNDVVGEETVTVTGTSRSDTTVTLKVNGAEKYTAFPGEGGIFSIPGARLAKDVNRGNNVLSIAAIDKGGVSSSEVPIEIKFNLEPAIALTAPIENARVSGASVIQVKASDENKDPLLFTYQIIPASDFDPTGSTSSPQAESGWLTLADAVPSSKFSWEATEVEDGEYFLRVGADDGTIRIYTRPIRITVKNTAPLFRFEDGRKTIVSTSTAVIIGSVRTPENISPRSIIEKIEYSVDNGKRWILARPKSGSNTAEVNFSVRVNALTEGTRNILFRAQDSRGLLGRATHAVVLDTTRPSAPIVLSPAVNAVIEDADDIDSIKKGTQIKIVGRAEALSNITIEGLGTSQSIKTNSVGAFTFAQVTFVEKGPYHLTVRSTDQAGNMSEEAAIDFIYDNPPKVSILTPKALRGLQGKATLQWNITDADGDTLQDITLKYRRGNQQFKTLPIDPTQQKFIWDVSAFPEGNDYQLSLSASDGIATGSATVDFSIDTKAPTLSSFSLKNTVIGKSASLLGSGTAAETLSGIEFVEYAILPESAKEEDADWVRATVTDGFLSSRARFTLNYPSTLVDGNYRILVRAVDAAGNVSPARSENFVVDGTPPRIGEFSISYEGVRIAPDRDGTLRVYQGELPFAVSLEGDTENASLSLSQKTFTLSESIASGLWEGVVSFEGEGAALALSAEDERGNAVKNVTIGSLAAVAKGSVTTRVDSAPVSEATIRVLLLNEETGRYAPLTASLAHGVSEAVTDEDGTYGLALPAGTYRLIMQKNGYKTVEENLSLAQASFVGVGFTTTKLSSVEGFIQSVFDYLRYGF